MHFIDSHCHLNLLKPHNLEKIIKLAKFFYIKSILNVAISIKDYKQSIKNLNKYLNILYTCGIHPLNEEINNIKNIKKLEKIVHNNKLIIALGETGLDFSNKYYDEELQKEFFLKHIELGITYNKPLVIHSRNSEIDIINILSSRDFKQCRGVIHSFTGNIELAKKIIDLGFYISFSGIVTFKNAFSVKEAVKFIPIDRLLIETDSPFLTPEPYRGQYNQPCYLLFIAKYISRLRNIDIYDLSQIIKNNFSTLFNL